MTGAGSPMAARLTEAVLRWRWPVLVLTLALSGLAASRLDQLEFDNSNESWMIEGDRSLELMNRFKEHFGNDDFVVVAFDAGEFFSHEPIRRMAALVADLEEGVPHLLDATWIGSAEWIEGRAESIEIQPLMDPLPETDAAIARAREIALSEPSFVDALISAEGDISAVMLEMDAYPPEDVDPRKSVTPAVREILAREEHADLATFVVGGPIMDYDLDHLTANEARKLGLLCLAVQLGILAWVGRGIRGVLVPAVVVSLSVIWTFGLIALLGFKLNMTVAMVPVLLICVGIGDSMHVIAELDQQRRSGRGRRDAIRRAMEWVAWPCLLTSLTTAAGFLAFLTVDIRPFRELGVYASVGVLVALGMTYVMVPILYSWGRDQAASTAASVTGPGSDVFDRILGATGRIVSEHPRAIVAAFVALTGLAVLGYGRVEISTDVIRMFREDVPLRTDFEWVDAHMGGSMSLEIMLDTGEPDGILDPDFLSRLDSLDRRIVEHPLTTKTVSILDVLRKMRKAFHENQEAYYDIPQSREEASQYLLLYDLSGGEERSKLVSFQNDVARLTVRTQTLSTADVADFTAEVEAWTTELLGDETDAALTGMLEWARAMTDLVARGQRSSFAAALVAITLMMILVLRSIRLALISMIPNVFPVLMTLGLMGWAGIPIDVMSVSFSALIIGVAVDDTIHFFVRYRGEFARRGHYAQALDATLRSVGRPITFTTLTLTLGFATLVASQIGSLGNFGLLTGYAFVWALLADFAFAPALLIWLQPLGPEREGVAEVG